jgi:hypothetical protein
MHGSENIVRARIRDPRGIGILGRRHCQNVHACAPQDALRLSVMTPPEDIGQTRERTDHTLLEGEEVEALRTRVAENLGWRKLGYSAGGTLIGLPPGSKKLSQVPSYGRDIKAAWEIVEFLLQRGVRTQVESKHLGGPLQTYVVEIGPHNAPISRSSYVSPALALCLAFDLAIKVILDKPIL